jgi:mercuric ion transport protein
VNRERGAAVGAIMSAFACSLCCVGSLLAVGLGLGVVGVGGAVEPLRPYLFGAAIVALAFGFSRAYARPKATCAPGGACGPDRRTRRDRIVLWVAAVAVVGFGLAPYVAGPLAAGLSETEAPSVSAASAPAAKATLKVKGMTCASCETTVRLALERTSGVVSASVSYTQGEAVVAYDPVRTNPAEVADAITRETGYKATPRETR